MQLFGGTYNEKVFEVNPSFTPFPGFGGVPEWNWDDFFHAFMMVFRVLCRETYQPMWDCISANSAAICVPFYICTLIVGSYVVLNLFLAVLLNAFNSDELKKKNTSDEDSRLRERYRKVKRFFKRKWKSLKMQIVCNRNGKNDSRVSPGLQTESVPEQQVDDRTDGKESQRKVTISAPNNDDAADDDDEQNMNERRNRRKSVVTVDTTASSVTRGETTHTAKSSVSQAEKVMSDCCWPYFHRFTCCDGGNDRFWRFRAFCFKICTHKAFEFTILAFIFLSSLSLCLQDANLVEGSTMDRVLTYMDYIYLAVFTLEMIIKIIAWGVRVYFTSFWTLLDFVIVATGYVDVALTASSSGVNLSSLRALRTLRALRPLRAISRWQGMKIVINALITAIPGIINVLLVVMIIWLIFAIMGVQFFAGKFWMCVESESGDRIHRSLAPTKEVCQNNPNWVWTTYFINFDNVFNAYLALFQMGSFEGWTTIFQLSVDAPEEIGNQPFPELNMNYYIYYVVFIVICSFFLLNLFVGVIIDDFNALKKKYEGGTALQLFMTDSQKQYYSTIRQLGSKKPKKAIIQPKNKFARLMFDIANSPRFEYAIAAVIGANVIAMATEHFDQSELYT